MKNIGNISSLKSKISAIAIAAILILSLSAAFTTCFQFANALTPSQLPQSTVPTHAFMTVSPNPVGVNQSVFVNLWLIEIDPLSNTNVNGQGVGTGATSGPSGDFSGYTVTVTLPDKTTTTLGPYTASDASTVDLTYTPTEVGNYSFTFNFPGQTLVGYNLVFLPINAYYMPSNFTAALTVEQTPLAALPETPLPTAYWQTPINWQNQGWYTISGNWFYLSQWNGNNLADRTGNFNPDMIAPQSAHILWTKPITGPLAFGGQIGGSMYNETDLSNYYTGKNYEPYFAPPIIINGVLFYNSPIGIQPDYGTYAVNLRTGQTLWYSNDTNEPLSVQSTGIAPTEPGISYGEVFSHHNPNEVGGLAYLWGVSGTTYSLYDATTGNWILNIVNSPGGTAVMGPEGELLVYTLHATNSNSGWLSMWNSTLCVGAAGFAANPWYWRPQSGATLQWSTGIQFNVTVPLYTAYDQYIGQSETEAISTVTSGVVLATTGSILYPQDYQTEVAYSATTGAFLWVENRSVAQSPGETQFEQMAIASNGVYVEFNKATMQFYGFSLLTGTQLWGPTNPLPLALSTYSDTYTLTDSGNAFVVGGVQALYAFSVTNGAPLWTWYVPPAGLQTAWPNYPLEASAPIAAGGLIFVGSTNSHGDQLYRGAQLYAVNATTGDLVWSVDDFCTSVNLGNNLAAADGDVVGLNGYDNQIYCFGQGPSKTTATAPDTAVTIGAPLLISGTVTDISAGSQGTAVTANYPNGLPCVSDASESQFMDAVYEQQPMPNNVTGVPVSLSAIDPNGNIISLGTATSDASGYYHFTVNTNQLGAGAGTYTVIATFPGSNSYYSSYAETSFVVTSPPAASPTPPTLSLASTQADIMTIGIAIIIVIVIGLAVLAIVLRKRT